MPSVGGLGGLVRTAKAAFAGDLAIVLQRPMDRREGVLVFRQLVPAEQADFGALRPRLDRRRFQGRAIEELDLADARNVVEREQLMHFEVGPRLLPRFPRRGGLGALVQFHEAGRQGPVADARRDRPAAQQHLVLPHGHGTDDDLRVVVVDETAVGADQPLALVTLRDLPDVRPHILARTGSWAGPAARSGLGRPVPGTAGASRAGRVMRHEGNLTGLGRADKTPAWQNNP